MKGIFIFEMLTLLSWFVIMSWANNLDVLCPSFIFASCLYYFGSFCLFLLLYKLLSYIFKPNEESNNVAFSVTVSYILVAGYLRELHPEDEDIVNLQSTGNHVPP
jgi:FtsH-binding integral membrane protein